jgi:hypothetical protein
MENSMGVLQKTKNRTAICSSNTTPRNILEGICQVTIKTHMLIAALFSIAKLWK